MKINKVKTYGSWKKSGETIVEYLNEGDIISGDLLEDIYNNGEGDMVFYGKSDSFPEFEELSQWISPFSNKSFYATFGTLKNESDDTFYYEFLGYYKRLREKKDIGYLDSNNEVIKPLDIVRVFIDGNMGGFEGSIDMRVNKDYSLEGLLCNLSISMSDVLNNEMDIFVIQ